MQQLRGIRGPGMVIFRQEERNKRSMKEILLINQRIALKYFMNLYGANYW